MKNQINVALKNNALTKEKINSSSPVIRRVKQKTFLHAHPIIYSFFIVFSTIILFAFINNISKVCETSFKINKLNKKLHTLQNAAIQQKSLIENKFETSKIKKYALKKLNMRELNENFVNFLTTDEPSKKQKEPSINLKKQKNNFFSDFFSNLIKKISSKFSSNEKLIQI